MGIPREAPYIWVTWLTKLLVGEDSCEWAAWFKAHHQSFDRVPSTFNNAGWQMEHTALLSETRVKLESDGDTVFIERQNGFTLVGNSGVKLGGRPDLIATKDKAGVILDTKTGQPRTSDHVQVMIYMWAIPRALRQYKGITFEGRVIYKDHEVPIPASAINEVFINNLVSLILRVSNSAPPRKVPSAMECEYCPIAVTECPERINGLTGESPEGETTEF